VTEEDTVRKLRQIPYDEMVLALIDYLETPNHPERVEEFFEHRGWTIKEYKEHQIGLWRCN
jgi:hypothetical protein